MNCSAFRGEEKTRHETRQDRHHDEVVSDRKESVDKNEALRESYSGCESRANSFWFEKFVCWVTSENCLVFYATDNTQAEMLFAKYANKTERGNDCFVFCDENGAPAITLVKPPPRYSSANNGESAMKVPSLSLAPTRQAVARSECGRKAVGIRMVGSC